MFSSSVQATSEKKKEQIKNDKTNKITNEQTKKQI